MQLYCAALNKMNLTTSSKDLDAIVTLEIFSKALKIDLTLMPNEGMMYTQKNNMSDEVDERKALVDAKNTGTVLWEQVKDS